GRDEGNTIRLTERNVSRRHVRLFRSGEQYLVEDLSRYGTRRNGIRMSGEEPLADGDIIIVGSYRVEFVETVGDDPDPPPVNAPTDTPRLPSDEVQAVIEAPPPPPPSRRSTRPD